MQCKQCHKDFTVTNPHTHNVKYCTPSCRAKANYWQHRDARLLYMREKYSRFELGKIKCHICSGFYKQLGTHIYQRHEMSAREYKQHYGLDVSKGLLVSELREIKREKTLENGTIQNLKKGEKYRYKKGESNIYQRSAETMTRLKKHWHTVASNKGRTLTVQKIKTICALCSKEIYRYPRAYQEGNNYCGVICRNRNNNKKS